MEMLLYDQENGSYRAYGSVAIKLGFVLGRPIEQEKFDKGWTTICDLADTDLSVLDQIGHEYVIKPKRKG
jgi:hypothetical protein